MKPRMLMALKVETENDDGFEHRNWETMVALNAETENDGGSKHWIWETMMALNAETKKDGDSKCMNGCEKRLWTPKWRMKMWLKKPKGVRPMALNVKKWKESDGFGCRMKKIDMRTLSAELKTWLWMPNRRHRLWHQTESVALNAKLKIWLWTSRWKNGFVHQTKYE